MNPDVHDTLPLSLHTLFSVVYTTSHNINTIPNHTIHLVCVLLHLQFKIKRVMNRAQYLLMLTFYEFINFVHNGLNSI